MACIAAGLLSQAANACEEVEYNPTPLELERDAREFFEQEAMIYEGVLLGGHDFDAGGSFLVLKVYKGPAQEFDVLQLPGGSSCYGGVTSFSSGFLTNYRTDFHSFDGFVGDRFVESWKTQGLIDDGVLTPTRIATALVLAVPAFALLGLIWFLRRLIKRFTRRRNASPANP